MHIIAIGYPKQPTYAHKRAAKEFFESLSHLIPCPICREHYSHYLQLMPITPHLDRRDDLFKWTVNLHNAVNERLGKPRVLESESLAFYRRIGARDKTPVIDTAILDELDMRSMMKGALAGGGLVFTVGALLWLINKGEKS
jgi:hypothetical protein